MQMSKSEERPINLDLIIRSLQISSPEAMTVALAWQCGKHTHSIII